MSQALSHVCRREKDQDSSPVEDQKDQRNNFLQDPVVHHIPVPDCSQRSRESDGQDGVDNEGNFGQFPVGSKKLPGVGCRERATGRSAAARVRHEGTDRACRHEQESGELEGSSPSVGLQHSEQNEDGRDQKQGDGEVNHDGVDFIPSEVRRKGIHDCQLSVERLS